MRRAAIDHPEWWEKETGDPFHWPDTYRGKGPYAGCQASYFRQPDDPILEDPDFARWYDPNKAGMLDDETPMMGTWDYCPPSESTWGHFWQDVLTHAYDSHYTPGLTTSIEYPAHEYCPYGVTAGQECPVCGLCACYCYYPWTWGYCTVLHKWADGALGLA